MKRARIILLFAFCLALFWYQGGSESCAETAANYTGFDEDDGDWYYYVNGKVATNKTGLFKGTVKNSTGWWYVKKGKVTFTTTVINTGKELRYIKKGKAQLHYDGFAKGGSGYYFFEDGKVDRTKTTIVKGEANGKTAWWYIENGKIRFVTGIYNTGKYDRYIKNGKAQLHYNGFVEKDGDWWYFNDGKLEKDTTTLVKGVINKTTAWWYVEKGKVRFVTGVFSPGKKLRYIIDGKAQLHYTGFATDYAYDHWYFEDGTVDTKRVDIIHATVDGITAWWYVYNGVITYDYTVAKNSKGWYVIRNGRIDFSFTGMASNQYGTWYIKKGKVDFSKNGLIYDEYYCNYCYVEGGKLCEKTLIAEYNGEYYYVNEGYVYQSYNGLGVTPDGKYVIKDGKVDISFNGMYGSNKVKKGKLVTDYTSEYETYEMKFRRVFGNKEIVWRSDAEYDSQEEADANMVPIEIKAWDFVDGMEGEKYTRTFTIYMNKAVAESVKKCFDEIYALPEKFPINSLGGCDFYYRSGQHGSGLAVDINPNENYEATIGEDGEIYITCGTLYEPGVNPYSIATDGNVAKILNKYGFTQGMWGNKVDYMHFSYFGN
ncbi:D-alanyl-D-alanine carboxypeptidase [Eubacterium ruminantium]|nr:D-alanyl-D-alanine carboxypeptidase [Eubacterium ruminantium]